MKNNFSLLFAAFRAGPEMKIYIFIALTLTLGGCFPSERQQEFYFGERVKVVGGFYKGCLGTLWAPLDNRCYVVDLRCSGVRIDEVSICEYNLQRVEDEK